MKGLRVALLFVAAAAMLLHVWQFRDFTVDDAAISYAYARNFAHGHGLVNIPGSERVEGYSNFLWVITLAIGVVLRDDVFLVAKIIAAILSVLLVIGSAELAAALRGRRSPIDVMPALFVATIMPISYWCMSGLEAPLYMALGVWCAQRLVRERDRPDARPFSALLAAGLALTRPDGILLWVAALGLRLIGGRWRKMLAWYALALAPVAAHFAFRYFYYAYPWPNTFYAKVHGRPFDPHELIDQNSEGWRYVIALYNGHHLSPLRYLAALTVLGVRRWYGRVVVIGLFAALIVFPVYARYDWMSEGRFVTPSLPLFITLFSDGAEQAASTLTFLVAWLWKRMRPRRELLTALLALIPQLYFAKNDLVPNEYASTLWRRGRYPVPAQGVYEHAVHYHDLTRQLEIAHPSAAEGDLGGTSMAGELRIYDLGALCDVTLAQQIENPSAIREYILDEARPTFFRLDGHWGGYRFTERPEFHDGWIQLSVPYLVGGHYIARSVFLPRGVDPRAALHSFEKEGLDLVGASAGDTDVRLWLLVREPIGSNLTIDGASPGVGGDLYPARVWRAGDLMYTRSARHGKEAPRVCGNGGKDCFVLSEKLMGAQPIELPAPSCAHLLARGELSAACGNTPQAGKIAGALYTRGRHAEEAGDLDRAYRDYRSALTLDPTQSFARKYLERLRMQRRDAYRPRWRLRLSAAERAFDLSPDEDHLGQLASAALAAGDCDAAVRAQAATMLAPRDKLARSDLAECDLELGRPQLGLPLLPEADSEIDDDEIAARTIRVAFAAERPDAARAALKHLSREKTAIAPGLVLTAAWARPLRAGDVELALALQKTGDAPELITVAGKKVPFDRAPHLWDPSEIFVHRVRLDLPAGKSRIVVGSTTLEIDAQPFSQDFESGRTDGWTRSGDAFADEPRQSGIITWGAEGAHWVDSISRGDVTTGVLRSPPLADNLDDVCFMVAGGNDREHLGVALEVDGQRVAMETGLNNRNFEEHCFELESLSGRAVRISVVDDKSGAWGHVLFDDLECSAHGRPAACAGKVEISP